MSTERPPSLAAPDPAGPPPAPSGTPTGPTAAGPDPGTAVDGSTVDGLTDEGDPVGEPTADAEFRDEVARIGRLLRTARSDRFSIEALARRSGVSAGLLSQIERGIGNPSFQTLGRVARALGLTMPDLFAGTEQPVESVPGLVRTHARRRITWPREHLSWEILTPPGMSEFTVIEGVQPPHFRETVFFKNAHYAGWLFHLTLEGSFVLNVDDELVALGPGDSLSCHSTQLRWIRNETSQPARMLAVLSPGAM